MEAIHFILPIYIAIEHLGGCKKHQNTFKGGALAVGMILAFILPEMVMVFAIVCELFEIVKD